MALVKGAVDAKGVDAGPDVVATRPQPIFGNRAARVRPEPREGTKQVGVQISAEPVKVERVDGIMFVTLNRPEARNAVNSALSQALGGALDEADRDPNVRVILLQATGSTFCAGADLKALAAGKSLLAPDNPEWGFGGFVRHHVDKPIVCALQGPALGGGVEIALASDLVVASEKAFLALPEVARGIMAAAGGAFRLPDQLPRKLAMEMLLTGRPISARRAEAMGLINHVVDAELVESVSYRLAESIAANAPLAVQATKRVARQVVDRRLPAEDGAWALNDAEATALRTTNDAREGAVAFIEKRSPVWSAS